MTRLMLNNELWSNLKESTLRHQIYDKPNLRMIVGAILYRMRVGCPLCKIYPYNLDSRIISSNNSIIGPQITT
ncbi:transposase [Legionella oakridgensis]|nr:transposase [Legionella oakridgensis]